MKNHRWQWCPEEKTLPSHRLKKITIVEVYMGRRGQGVSLVLKYLPPMPMLPLDLTNIACFISEILAVSWLGVVYILALSGKEGKGG